MKRLAILVALIFVNVQADAGGAEPSEVEPSETDRLNRFFEESFQEGLDRSPTRQTKLGIKNDYDKWDNLSDAEATRRLAITVKRLAALRSNFDYDQLQPQAKLSYRLFEYDAEQEIASYPWRSHQFPINQMFGVHSMLPAFLISFHRVDSVDDARAYVSRLRGIEGVFDQVIGRLRKQQSQGILPPKFVFPLVIDDCRNVLKGKPFDDSDDPSALLNDFSGKVRGIEAASEAVRQELLEQASTALTNQVRPAYQRLISALQDLSKSASNNDGAWKLPSGVDYYNHSLRKMTTTSLSADEIHRIGLADVDRIQDEMRQIMRRVKFKGLLQESFQFMREDDQFYYPNTDDGRQAYMTDAKKVIDRMRADLDRMFLTKPRAKMIVKRVEPFREKSAGLAFYESPAPDGSRPGIYYANLHNMMQMPNYQMEALAFHEGIPGHHMQLSISQELQGIPKFRRFGGYTAYVEGWGLYCERLPKEFGYYQDPYSDFGRLAMEVWRAARLVVDTGMHHHRWTRQQAIDYLVENTPDNRDECVRAINRYLVMPGQATAYKIGMMKILELRKHAQGKLGDAYDIREFHDVILGKGALPLALLEGEVEQWIEDKLDEQ